MANHQGLTEKESADLKKEFGENTLPSKERSVWLRLLFNQFKSPLIYILFFVALVSFFFKHYLDFLLIMAVVLLNIGMGFYQEFSAHKTLKALRSFLKSTTTVIRGGVRRKIETKELVPGDLVFLGNGDRIPADGVLSDDSKLLVNEAILTGEEEAVNKSNDEMNNRLFMGTTVVSGVGILKVEKIGNQTEIGKINLSLADIREEKTNFQIKLENFSKNLAYIIAIACAFIFLLGVLSGQQRPWEMFQVAVILSVAAIPEGLPIAITVIMALGMRRILKKKGLVKKLISLENIGSVSVICTDKTGTLTEGVMKVVRTDLTNQHWAFLSLALANNQRTNLEVAFWQYLKESPSGDPQILFDKYPRLHHEPFDSEKKYQFTINNIDGKQVGFYLGAPEILLSFCALSQHEKSKELAKIDNWAAEGLRVVGVAFQEARGGNESALKEKNNYIWLGLIAVEDPIREGAKEAIMRARQAGIDVKIITGDYRKTAERLALNLGFSINSGNILEGKDLEVITTEELAKRVEDVIIFARVSPHQKLKIVQALKAKGEVVAMIGDGVNDALALETADVGVVVGGASDVAKETADLILLDGNIQTILAAVAEGRVAFANIKKVVSYVLSNCFAEIVLIFGAMILRLPTPLLIVQILWIHLICDGPPDILLSFEPADHSLMKVNPRDLAKEPILSRPMKILVAVVSSTVGLLALLFFWYFQRKAGDLLLARSMAFAIIAAVSLIYIFSFKNLERPFFKTKNFFANKYLFWGVLYGFFLLMAAIYVPWLNKILGTTPLGFKHWILVFGVGFFSVFLVEITKFFEKRIKKSSS